MQSMLPSIPENLHASLWVKMRVVSFLLGVLGYSDPNTDTAALQNLNMHSMAVDSAMRM
jgi:hypothetical protein